MKEQEIDNLKRNIDINNSYFDDLTQNSKHIKFNQYFINDNIEEIDIEKNIQLFMNENDKLTNNLNSIFNIYDKQINQKDKVIQNLENQLNNGQYNNYDGANQLKLNDKINISQNNNDNYKKTKTNNLGKNDKINLDEVKRNNYMNIIYNRLNNINDENSKKQQKKFDIHNKESDNKINSEYFKVTQEGGNNRDSNIELNKIKTDDDTITDLDELINKNNLIKSNQELEPEKK